MIRELVVISGKGGTGKTSVTASLAVLAGRAVVADCDVDAADLHLVLEPTVRERHDFVAGHEAVIRAADCRDCGICHEACRYGAVLGGSPHGPRRIDPVLCEGCGICVRRCPEQAIDFPERRCGEWMISSVRTGPMVHARLGIAAENSGKLVATVRREARRLAAEGDHDLIIIDGPPGIGCPVIASLTGATVALVVTEPTVSGAHDLERVLALTRHFAIPTAVCVNKWDLNPEFTERIEEAARLAGAVIAGRLRYDPGVTRAQIAACAVVEIDTPVAVDIRRLWNNLQHADPNHHQEDQSMRIAIPLAAGMLCQHFGHCDTFAFVDVDPADRSIQNRNDVTPPPHQPGLLPVWLAEQAATLVIAGGMGQRARMLLEQQGIATIVGAPALEPEQIVNDYLGGTLVAGENVCDH